MRIGYSAWGSITDGKVDKPSGCMTYVPFILNYLLEQRHKVYWMQKSQDYIYDKVYYNISKHYFKSLRKKVLNKVIQSDMDFPELDILIVEWRWPIPGRNIVNRIAISDLKRQNELLQYYTNKNTRLIIWDLDYKLTYEDEKKWKPDLILETAIKPKFQYIKRTRVNIPIIYDAWKNRILNFNYYQINELKKIVYIGNRYERDEIIDKYIQSVAKAYPYTIHFYGNWRKYPDKFKDAILRWPDICFYDRITLNDFYDVYKDAWICPLLAKKEYNKHGFMTARLIEALWFGTIPIGFTGFYGIKEYLPKELIMSNSLDILEMIADKKLTKITERRKMAYRILQKIRKNDIKYFMQKLGF